MPVLLAALDPTIVTAIAGAILSGGLLGAAAMFRKSGPEADQIVAKTLIEVNEYLRKELDERDKKWAAEVERRDKEIDRLQGEIGRLRDRLKEVQDDLQRVESELSQVTRGSAPPARRP